MPSPRPGHPGVGHRSPSGPHVSGPQSTPGGKAAATVPAPPSAALSPEDDLQPVQPWPHQPLPRLGRLGGRARPGWVPSLAQAPPPPPGSLPAPLPTLGFLPSGVGTHRPVSPKTAHMAGNRGMLSESPPAQAGPCVGAGRGLGSLSPGAAMGTYLGRLRCTQGRTCPRRPWCPWEGREATESSWPTQAPPRPQRWHTAGPGQAHSPAGADRGGEQTRQL